MLISPSIKFDQTGNLFKELTIFNQESDMFPQDNT